MGFYGRFVLPRLIDLSCRSKVATERRSALVPGASGAVLEVGVGSGLNLRFYSSASVTRLVGVDPSQELLSMARKRAEDLAFPVDLRCESAEALSLDDESFDTIVMTFTLCSIPEPLRALREMRRVLKAGGRLLFAEHGLSPDAGVRRWQERLNPVWSRLAGGCNLNRKIDALLAGGGFRVAELREAYLPGPRPLTYTYEGSAL
jgi:ubiquinone/menaquinone biosynthesis C-methylase UbiE